MMSATLHAVSGVVAIAIDERRNSWRRLSGVIVLMRVQVLRVPVTQRMPQQWRPQRTTSNRSTST